MNELPILYKWFTLKFILKFESMIQLKNREKVANLLNNGKDHIE
jgi:hypothetical protein